MSRRRKNSGREEKPANVLTFPVPKRYAVSQADLEALAAARKAYIAVYSRIWLDLEMAVYKEPHRKASELVEPGKFKLRMVRLLEMDGKVLEP